MLLVKECSLRLFILILQFRIENSQEWTKNMAGTKFCETPCVIVIIIIIIIIII